MMQNLEKIRFVTANYPRLKGLNMVVIGFWTLCTALWSSGRPGDLSGPILFLLLTVVLSIIVNRYYRRVFGQVRVDKQTYRREIWISLIFGFGGLVAYVIDSVEILPVSVIGLWFALAIWFDYRRINRSTTENYLAYYHWFVVGLLILSILPAFGLDALLNQIGFDRLVTGMLALIGVLLIIIGLFSHFFLVRSMPVRAEVNNDELV